MRKNFAAESGRTVAFFGDFLEEEWSAEEARSSVWWETLRFLYFTHKLPPYWRKLADKEDIPTSRPAGHYDVIFGAPEFPHKTWEDVEEETREAIYKALAMPKGKAVRFIDAHEGRWAMRRLLAEAEKIEKAAQGTREEFQNARGEAPSIATSPRGTLEYPDGTFVACVHIDPSQGKLAIKKAVVNEIEALAGKIQAIREDNQVRQWKTRLRGLASLWLKEAGYDEAVRNRNLFGGREEENEDDEVLRRARKDRTALKNAEQAANELITFILDALSEAGDAYDREVERQEQESEGFFQRAKDSGLLSADDEGDAQSQP